MRPFALVAWGFLTLGIAMGSYWAYYTLGWGGFWFWDPVENASLMPWLAGTAFLHSVAVMEKRDALKVWTIFLAILAFSFSLLGTFLVRSGVLTSVHAFASDPRRGVFILVILALFIVGSFALFAWRAPMLKQGGLFAPISREGALVLNNLLLTTACATVFFGTLYPLALERADRREDHRRRAVLQHDLRRAAARPPAAVTPIGFSLAWKRGDLLGVVQRLAVASSPARSWRSPGPLASRRADARADRGGLAIFVMLGTLIEVVTRAWRRGLSAGAAFRRAAGLPLSFWGAALAHIGVGVTLLGPRRRRLRRRGDRRRCTRAFRSTSAPTRSRSIRSSNAVGRTIGTSSPTMTVRAGGRVVATIEPARRRFAAQPMTTTQAGMATLNFGQIYVSDRRPDPRRRVPARLYWKPLVTLIWLGGCAMALGGALSLADRRLRFGAPVRAQGRGAVARYEPPRVMPSWRRLRGAHCLRVASRPRAAPLAVQPDEMMKDPALEARARALSDELRCMVCQNQSIDDSDAPLARDIRLLIRQRIAQGESNDAVRDFLVSRYGDFILLKPPLKPETLLLWLARP